MSIIRFSMIHSMRMSLLGSELLQCVRWWTAFLALQMLLLLMINLMMMLLLIGTWHFVYILVPNARCGSIWIILLFLHSEMNCRISWNKINHFVLNPLLRYSVKSAFVNVLVKKQKLYIAQSVQWLSKGKAEGQVLGITPLNWSPTAIYNLRSFSWLV